MLILSLEMKFTSKLENLPDETDEFYLNYPFSPIAFIGSSLGIPAGGTTGLSGSMLLSAPLYPVVGFKVASWNA
jgi:hypothetical protein